MEHQKIHDHLVQVYGRAGYNEITTKNPRYLNESKTVWEIDVEAKIKTRLHVDEIFYSVATNNTFDGRTQVINEPAYPVHEKEKSTPMDMKQYFRRPFDVNAVEVTPDNAEQVAEWCGGTVAQGDYKHSKYKIQLPVVKVPGNGPHKGKTVDARIGYFVVEHNGSFRVYRPQQFEQTFHPYSNDAAGWIKAGDLVRDKRDGMEGQVMFVDQILVDYGPMTGNVLHGKDELERIRDLSPETLQRLKEEAEVAVGAHKLNALRAAAEEAIRSGQGPSAVGCFPPVEGDLSPVEEINGYRKDMRVRVTHEHNAFVDQFGTIKWLDPNGVTLWVDMDGDEANDVAFQPDEVQPIGPKLQSGDMIETLIPHEFDGAMIPVGTNGRVTVTGVLNEPNTEESVEVLFADGHYHYFLPAHLKKV